MRGLLFGGSWLNDIKRFTAVKNKKIKTWFLLFFLQHGILTPSVYGIEYLLRPSVWMILIPPVIFPHWRGSRTKQQSYIQTHAMWRRDRSFRDLALNVWRVSALLSPGSYVGAIEARWLRRCFCPRRKNKKNFTTQDTCAIFNVWVLSAWVLHSINLWVLA